MERVDTSKDNCLQLNPDPKLMDFIRQRSKDSAADKSGCAKINDPKIEDSLLKKLCWFGKRCFRKKCSFNHEDYSAPPKCRFGPRCQRKSCLFKHLDDCDNKIGCSSKDTCPKRHVEEVVDKPNTEHNDLTASDRTDTYSASSYKIPHSNTMFGRSIASGPQLLNSTTFPSTSGASAYQPMHFYSNSDSYMGCSAPSNTNQPKSTSYSHNGYSSSSNTTQQPTFYLNVASYDEAPGFDTPEYYYNDSSFQVFQEPSDYNSNSYNSNQYYGNANQRIYPVKRLSGFPKNVACRYVAGHSR